MNNTKPDTSKAWLLGFWEAPAFGVASQCHAPTFGKAMRPWPKARRARTRRRKRWAS